MAVAPLGELGWQRAFEEAWASYCAGGSPIGACVIDDAGAVASVGRNQVYKAGSGVLSGHQLAHAEINAILELSEVGEPNMHPNIRRYTLYTTLEPCPLCFGAVVMGSIRRLKFATRDNWGGSSALNTATPYIQSKKIAVEGPFKDLEVVYAALHACYHLGRENPNIDILLAQWSEICPEGIAKGRKLHADGELSKIRSLGGPLERALEAIAKA